MAEQERCPDRMFRLQWQDILATARRVAKSYVGSLPTDATATILNDIAKFLDHRNLAYFVGFGQNDNLDFFPIKSGGWIE